MKQFKKVLSLVLAFTLVMSMLAACGAKEKETSKTGDNPKSTTTQAPVKKNPVTISTVSMFGGTDPNAGTYQAINSQFMKDNDYITIEDESQTSDQDWKTKIAVDFSVGNEPDVIQYFTDANASDVLAANKFVDIATIKAEYPDYAKDTLENALKSAANPDGVQRAVPTTGYWEGLFCNKDLFDKYNLELPTDWDKMTKAIDTFKKNKIVPIAVSLNKVPHYWIEYLLLSAAGAEGYTQVPKTVPAEWAKGLEMFKTLRDSGAFPVDADTIDNDFAGELFKSKKAAMQLDGSWYAGGVTDQDNTVVVNFPVIPGGKAVAGAMVGGISSGFYITKKAWDDPDKRDAAVKFVMAHTNATSVAKYWNGNGQAATKVDAVANMKPLGISGMNYSQAATSVSSPTDSRINQEAYNTLVAGIVDVSTGKKTAQKLLEEVLAVNAKK